MFTPINDTSSGLVHPLRLGVRFRDRYQRLLLFRPLEKEEVKTKRKREARKQSCSVACSRRNSARKESKKKGGRGGEGGACLLASLCLSLSLSEAEERQFRLDRSNECAHFVGPLRTGSLFHPPRGLGAHSVHFGWRLRIPFSFGSSLISV